MRKLSEKPNRTKVNDLNWGDWMEFKERRRFDSWRTKGHFYFDKIWEDAKLMKRQEAYIWLSEKMNIEIEKTHFGHFNNLQCKEAIFHCQQLFNDNRRLDLDFGIKPITPFYILEKC